MCWFHTFICCNIITTVALGNASAMSHDSHFSSVVRTVQTQSLGSSGAPNAAWLTGITVLCASTPEPVASL